MNKLQTRFGLVLSTVLLTATIFPIVLLFLLSKSGLVEAVYVAEGTDARQPFWFLAQNPDAPTENDNSSLLPPNGRIQWENGRLVDLQADLETGKLVPGIFLDPQTGRWIANFPADIQRVILTSPVFKFRVDLPAWLAIGSLPLAGMLLGILLSVVMSRSVTRPVSQLADAVQAVGRRELGSRVQSKGSQELQDLANAFNRMAEDLEDSETNRRNLMADVAHELRTPLAVLDGNLRAMLDGVHGMNEEEIALLYEQTHHLNRLVDDLRELSLAEADQLSLDCQEIDLASLAKEAASHFELSAQEQGIQLKVEVDEPLIHPSLDGNRIRQVLHNLLSNAFRYTPSGGNVLISAKRVVESSSVDISVADSGIGLSPEALPHVFDRFYRAENTAFPDRGGTGLGLAIVKALVEVQGGNVRVESGGRNQGCTFYIRFPIPQLSLL